MNERLQRLPRYLDLLVPLSSLPTVMTSLKLMLPSPLAAASNAMAGRPEQAHKAVDRLWQPNPPLRVSTLKDVVGPYRRAEDLSRFEEGLRQAGLPE